MGRSGESLNRERRSKSCCNIRMSYTTNADDSDRSIEDEKTERNVRYSPLNYDQSRQWERTNTYKDNVNDKRRCHTRNPSRSRSRSRSRCRSRSSRRNSRSGSRSRNQRLNTSGNKKNDKFEEYVKSDKKKPDLSELKRITVTIERKIPKSSTSNGDPESTALKRDIVDDEPLHVVQRKDVEVTPFFKRKEFRCASSESEQSDNEERKRSSNAYRRDRSPSRSYRPSRRSLCDLISSPSVINIKNYNCYCAPIHGNHNVYGKNYKAHHKNPRKREC